MENPNTAPLYDEGEEVFDRGTDQYGTIADVEKREEGNWYYYLMLEDGDHVWAREDNIDFA